MNFEDFKKMVTEAGKESMTPILMMKDYPYLENLHNDVKNRADALQEEMDKILEQVRKLKQKFWKDAEEYLLKEKILKKSDVSLTIKNGVLFLVED